ncbi:hypothetical protein [Cognatiyoonia sp. IB215182]|uniref:hypothetical protein n=1 Tax=Cognatiyoonia sp. IB215182 TaxID=3097353 RepID=UPI002A126B9D|nr:hypothetical protein [Cognatiyoonia sp. IB215182]MDX8350884.1 hypothetical protein [Cognatiyoonia sp. IB215182]
MDNYLVFESKFGDKAAAIADISIEITKLNRVDLQALFTLVFANHKVCTPRRNHAIALHRAGSVKDRPWNTPERPHGAARVHLPVACGDRA